MDIIVHDLAPEGLLELNEANLFDYIRTYAKTSNSEFLENDELMLSVNEMPAVSMFCNCVFKANIHDENRLGKIVDEILARYRARRLPVYWYVSPATSPNGLSPLLRSKKMMHIDTYSFMSADLKAFGGKRENSAIQIRQVTDIETFRQWLRLYIVCFEMAGAIEREMLTHQSGLFLDRSLPAFHYIGYLGGRPVGTSTVFFGSGIAGIYNIVTAPEARNLGVAHDMTTVALEKAREEGFRHATLQATRLGAPVYRRLGFKSDGDAECFIRMNGRSSLTLTKTFIMRKTANFLRSRFMKIRP